MWSWNRRALPPVNYNESSSDSSAYNSPGANVSPPPGTPVEDDLGSLRNTIDRQNTDRVIDQLADRLNASLRSQSDQDQDQEDPQQRQIMTNYDEETGVDSANALENACRALKGYEFGQLDLDFYFHQVELQLRTNGVKKSYTKFLVLTSILPSKVRDQVKPLLRKQESDYEGQMPYKVLKDKILQIFRPPQESDF